MKKIIETLSSVPATIVGGVFLVASFVLSKTGVTLPVDPAWVPVVISGVPLVYLALRRIIHNKGISKISSALLISIAMVAAIAIGDLFAAGEVAFIMALGEILEDMTTERAKKGLKPFLTLTPTRARRLTAGTEEIVDATAVVKDDILRVLAGETIPADGIIVSGETSVDQSVMTGESLPVDKIAGDTVYCGTLNCFGAVDIRVTKAGEDSSLQTLIRMVKEAEEKKAPTARIADMWASWLVPAALLVAIITWVVTRDITRAVTVLVVFCPCALVLATPTAIMAAIGQATKHGVIIKSGEALEKMGRVDTVAFDKTGTLTVGAPAVSDCIPFADSYDRKTLLA
ncbi:MAG: cation-translocating P-type ATPase, partial [Clostridia bacterium]|nr:cation-translocating P-type ATPase [Clostridia bacterium]